MDDLVMHVDRRAVGFQRQLDDIQARTTPRDLAA